MKKITIKKIYSFTLFACLSIGSSGPLLADLSDEIDQQQAREKAEAKQTLDQLKKDIKSLQNNLGKTRKKQSNALKKLRSAEKQIATAAKILRSTSRQLKAKEKELGKLRKRQVNLEANKIKHKKALADQLRAAYMNGKQEYLKLLLNQQDPDELGRMLVYYDYMNKARTTQVNDLKNTLAELKNIDESIQAEIKRLNVLKRAKQSETKQLQKLKKKRKSIVDNLAKEIINKSDRLTELQISEQELQQLVDTVSETIEQIDFSRPLTGLRSQKGKLNWPVKGKQIRKYGSTNQGQRSSGVVIGGNEGKEINAIHFGRVIYADWLRGFGLLLIIDHGKGYMSLYGYNQALYKDVGDWVESGEAVATLGQSGGQKQSALYFELRHQGKPINPRRWFRK